MHVRLLFVISLWLVINTPQSYATNNEDITDNVDVDTLQWKPIGIGRPQLKADEVDGFPPSELFFTKYAVPQRPLVMRNAAKVSPAFYKWTDDYFLSLDIPEDETVDVEEKKKEDRSGNGRQIHFQEFVRIYNFSDIYLVQNVPSYLKKDLMIPCMLRCPDMAFLETVMWFSSGGTKSVLHNDDVDNINCLYRGRKELLIIDIKYRHFYHFDHAQDSYSGVDVDSVDYTKYPGLAQVEYYNVSLSAGDCLFIPYLWAHQVRSYDSNLAVNIWWDHSENSRVQLSQCSKRCNDPLTYEQIKFQSLEQTMVAQIKHRLSLIMGSQEFITVQHIIDILVEDGHFSNPKDVPIIRESMENALKPADSNNDGRLSVNEITSCSNENWGEFVNLLKQLEKYNSDGNEALNDLDSDDTVDEVEINEVDDVLNDDAHDSVNKDKNYKKQETKTLHDGEKVSIPKHATFTKEEL